MVFDRFDQGCGVFGNPKNVGNVLDFVVQMLQSHFVRSVFREFARGGLQIRRNLQGGVEFGPAIRGIAPRRFHSEFALIGQDVKVRNPASSLFRFSSTRPLTLNRRSARFFRQLYMPIRSLIRSLLVSILAKNDAIAKNVVGLLMRMWQW